MKKLVLLLLLCLPFLGSNAQVRLMFNPQLGVTFQSLTDDSSVPSGSNNTIDADFSADLGFMAGFDLRMGNRLYFQPGVFFTRNTTVTKLKGDTLITGDELKDKLVRSSLKLKALAGFNLIQTQYLKLRLNAGPTYDFILSVDNSDDNIDFDEKDFNGGSFNFDAGLGIDIWAITAELGYSYGLTEAFDNNNNTLSLDSKFSMLYVSLGIAIGSSGK